MAIIQPMDTRRVLRGIDLNLLVALDALLEEQNVTLAGKRIGLSQSATSSALGRLRELFADPLLVRVPGGMSATPLARALRARVREVLDAVSGLLEPPGNFDPSSPHRFSLAVTDYVGLVLLPGLLGAMAREGSQLAAEVRNIDGWQLPVAELDAGRVDVALSFFRDVPVHLSRELLFDDGFLCLVRRDHPIVRKRLGIRQFAELPHLLVSPRADVTGVVDASLAVHDLTRRVTVTVPHFMAAPAILAETSCIATLPSRITRMGQRLTSLRALAPPLQLPRFTVEMVWHPQTEHHPPARWLRERIREAARSVRESPRTG